MHNAVADWTTLIMEEAQGPDRYPLHNDQKNFTSATSCSLTTRPPLLHQAVYFSVTNGR
jgi:hypothetical protein